MKYKLFLAIFIGLFSFANAQTQVNDNYKGAVIKLMQVSKSSEAMKQLMPQMTAMIKKQVPELSEERLKLMEDAFVKMYDRIIDEMIPIYKKYLTLSDINKIIEFYDTPVGKKLAVSNIQIANESMPLAQKIAMETMQTLLPKLKGENQQKQP